MKVYLTDGFIEEVGTNDVACVYQYMRVCVPVCKYMYMCVSTDGFMEVVGSNAVVCAYQYMRLWMRLWLLEYRGSYMYVLCLYV